MKTAEEFLSDIAFWCETTFGPISPERLVERAQEEMDELRVEVKDMAHWNNAAKEEAADVLIILSRIPGLIDAVNKKMMNNHLRKWELHGDGTGHHIKSAIPFVGDIIRIDRHEVGEFVGLHVKVTDTTPTYPGWYCSFDKGGVPDGDYTWISKGI